VSAKPSVNAATATTKQTASFAAWASQAPAVWSQEPARDSSARTEVRVR